MITVTMAFTFLLCPKPLLRKFSPNQKQFDLTIDKGTLTIDKGTYGNVSLILWCPYPCTFNQPLISITRNQPYMEEDLDDRIDISCCL